MLDFLAVLSVFLMFCHLFNRHTLCELGIELNKLLVFIYMCCNLFTHFTLFLPVLIAQVVERPLREREVVGSKPGRAIPKALKMVPVATLLGAQHYKASTGFSHSLLTQTTLHKKKKKLTPTTWFTGTRLMSPSGVKIYRKIDSFCLFSLSIPRNLAQSDDSTYVSKICTLVYSSTS